MHNTKALLCTAMTLCLFASGCTGPRNFTDSEKAILSQTQVIKLDVSELGQDSSQSRSMTPEDIERIIRPKIVAAGLAVAEPKQDYDASLAVTYSYFRWPSLAAETGYAADTVFMQTHLNFRHKKLGHIFRAGFYVPTPHKTHFESEDIIARLDEVLLQNLRKKPGMP